MPKNQDKRAWSDQEIEYLKVGFKMCIRLKVIAKVLKRSETSVNKALSRFGIRPYGVKGRVKNNKKILSYVSTDTYQQALNKHCRETAPSQLFSDKENQPKNSKNLDLQQENKLPLSPYFSIDSVEPLQKRVTPNQSNDWIDFDSAITLLQDMGDQVMYSSNNLQRKTIFVNGKPLTAQQMLLRLNRLRLQADLEPVYIANITEF